MASLLTSLIGQAAGASDVDGLDDTTITAAAKGDMLVHNGTAWIDLTVGSNDEILTADSAEASGIKWAAAAAGGTSTAFQYQTGYYFGPPFTASSATTEFTEDDRIWLSPIHIPADFSADRAAFYVSSAAASKSARLGLYNIDATTGNPTTVAHDFGTVSVATTGVKEITISETISAGNYYMAIQPEGDITIYSTAGGSGHFFSGCATAADRDKGGIFRYTATYAGGLIDLTGVAPDLARDNELLFLTLRKA
jgi:hypothetical protein